MKFNKMKINNTKLNNIKRFIAFILIFLLPAPVFSGCAPAAQTNAGKINVVCTIFPQYDWVRQIAGEQADNLELTLLLDNSIDLHNFQPSVDDIVKISTCDLFIYVGGESDEWVEDALSQATNKNMAVINLLDELGGAAKEEELLEGMEDDEHEHGHDEDEHGHDDDEHGEDEHGEDEHGEDEHGEDEHGEDEHGEDEHGEDEHGEDEHGEDEHGEDEYEHDDEIEYDEHVWLSLKNAQIFCAVIADALTALNADNAEIYQSNLAGYTRELAALDANYQAAVGAASCRTLLFADRFPFRYLVDDYGLTPYAAFSGCSAETEASFETIVFLADKVDELNLQNIMVTESADQSLAQTVIESTRDKNQQIKVLNAMQSISANDVKNGATYLAIMESNLNALKEALN